MLMRFPDRGKQEYKGLRGIKGRGNGCAVDSAAFERKPTNKSGLTIQFSTRCWLLSAACSARTTSLSVARWGRELRQQSTRSQHTGEATTAKLTLPLTF